MNVTSLHRSNDGVTTRLVGSRARNALKCDVCGTGKGILSVVGVKCFHATSVIGVWMKSDENEVKSTSILSLKHRR